MSAGEEYDDLKKMTKGELDKELVIHVTPIFKPCNHDWDNDGCNPEFCLKCGMSFTRYIFTECP